MTVGLPLAGGAIRPEEMVPATAVRLLFAVRDGQGLQPYQDLGSVGQVTLSRTTPTLTYHGDRGDGGLAVVREEAMAPLYRLRFSARQWNAMTLRSFFLTEDTQSNAAGITLQPGIVSAIDGAARVIQSPPDGPDVVWDAPWAVLRPGQQDLPLDGPEWVDLPFELMLHPPFGAVSLTRQG